MSDHGPEESHVEDEFEPIEKLEGTEASEEAASNISAQIQHSMLEKKLLYTFNRFFIDFLKDAKAKNRAVSLIVKKHYKCIDKMSSDYVDAWQEAFDHAQDHWSASDKDVLVELADAEVFKGVTVSSVLDKLEAPDRSIVGRYIYTLHVLNALYRELDDSNSSEIETMFGIVVAAMKAMDAKQSLDHVLQDVVDDDLKAVLYKMGALGATLPSASPASDPASGAEKPSMPPLDADFFEKSKIGKLAKDISSSIDMSKLNISDPSDLLNMEKLMSGNNAGLANIIQQVGNTITQKIQSGELKQEDLITDAMSMVSKLNGGGGGGMGGMGGMMGDMMKMMMKGPLAGGIKKKSSTSVRDRLKRKLENSRAREEPNESQ